MDSHEYILYNCHYIALIQRKESENNVQEIFIYHYFTLTMKGVNSENKLNDIFHECIDKKKMWTLIEKSFGANYVKLPWANEMLMVTRIYLYVVLIKSVMSSATLLHSCCSLQMR